MQGSTIKLDIAFYAETSGKEPVKVWLKDLEKHDRVIIGQDIKRVQIGWPLGMPLVKPLGSGLWEIRSSLGSRIARTIFTLYAGKIILLHGFIKKSQKIPAGEIELAKKRSKQLLRMDCL
ncbi:MAG: type II toxin-antitoxin system RelE/ParE family toxin [Candidatus Babeliales bacterium]